MAMHSNTGSVKTRAAKSFNVCFTNRDISIGTPNFPQENKNESLANNRGLEKVNKEKSCMDSKMQEKSKSIPKNQEKFNLLEGQQAIDDRGTITKLTNENIELRKKLAMPSNYGDPVKDMKIKLERANCKAEKDKVKRLEAQLKSELEAYNKETKNSDEKLAKKKARIAELESVLKLSSADQTKYLEKITSLENQLQETNNTLTSSQNLNQSFDKANKTLIFKSESILKEKKSLEEKINEQILLMTEKEKQFEKAQKTLEKREKKISNLKESIAALKRDHETDKSEWESKIKDKSDEIGNIKEKHVELTRFVENLKIKSGFDESKGSPTIKELEDHICSKLHQVNADSSPKAGKLPPKKRKSTSACNFTMNDLFGDDDIFETGCHQRPKMAMREQPNDFIQTKAYNNFGIPSITVVFQNPCPGSSSARRVSAIQFCDNGK